MIGAPEVREPIPTRVRRQVLLRANFRCEDCGTDDAPLEMHHLTYVKRVLPTYDPADEVCAPIFGLEAPEDLAALCRGCHHARHLDPNGTFWRDPEEMEEHWEPYRHAMGRDD